MILMSMYSLIEYSDGYSKTWILRQFYRDAPALDDNSKIVDLNVNNVNTRSFNLKVKLTGKTGNNGTKDVEIMVSIKCLSDFWKTLEILLINCEIINRDLN